MVATGGRTSGASGLLKSYSFTHPFYRAGSESLLDAASSLSEERAIACLDRSLFSLSSQTAEAAAANLSWVYDRLNSESAREVIVEIAIDGLRSMFLNVRDKCLSFLVKKMNQLKPELQGKLPAWANSVSLFSLKDVEWRDDAPQIPAVGMGGIVEVDAFPARIDETQVKSTLNAFQIGAPVVISAESAANAARFLADNPARMTHESAGRLLTYDVALIRAPVARAWLALPRTDDERILSLLFADEHPAVVAAAMLGICRNWWECAPTRQARLKFGLLNMADSPVAATAMITLLETFNRREQTGMRTPWEIFEALMPKVMSVLPLRAALNDARLYDVVMEATEHISIDTLLEIVDGWTARLRELVEFKTPGDYLLGVTDILLHGTLHEPLRREDRVARLLSVTGTAARVRIVADLVNSWNSLTESEQNDLTQELTKQSEDSVWLRAAALTRRVVPAQLQAMLLPGGVKLEDEPSELRRRVPLDLLNAAIQVHTAMHPVIYYVGASGRSGSLWDSVVYEIAKEPEHPLFELAFEYLISQGEVERAATIVRELGVHSAKRIFALMMRHKMETNGGFMQEVWIELFKIAPDEESREEWIARMAEAAPTVLDNLSEAFEWVPESCLEDFFRYFNNDVYIIKLLGKIESSIGRKEDCQDAESMGYDDAVTELVRKCLETLPICHASTYEVISTIVRKLGVQDGEFFAELNARRIGFLESRPQAPYAEPPILTNWVDSLGVSGDSSALSITDQRTSHRQPT
jgi:hypothetical protein